MTHALARGIGANTAIFSVVFVALGVSLAFDPSAAALPLLLGPASQTHSGSAPKWSSNGNQILFVDGRYPEGREVFVMNADGSGRQQLTANHLGHEYPTLSPDAKTILFSTYRSGSWKLYVMDADGSNERDLGMESTASDLNDPCRAEWSPDGRHFAFPLTRNNERRLHIANRDGSGVIPVPNGRGLYPHWSRDGESLVFYANANIHTINLDGTNRRQLTSNDSQSSTRPNYPQWSKDGRAIFFLKGDHIFKINRDGTREEQVTRIPGMKWYLGMSPQGQMVYSCVEGELDQIYVVGSDGRNRRLVTR